MNGTSMGTRAAADGYVWRVGFVPGELKAVGRADGKAVAEAVVRTSGTPTAIRLTPYFGGALRADGGDLEYAACAWCALEPQRELSRFAPKPPALQKPDSPFLS